MRKGRLQLGCALSAGLALVAGIYVLTPYRRYRTWEGFDNSWLERDLPNGSSVALLEALIQRASLDCTVSAREATTYYVCRTVGSDMGFPLSPSPTYFRVTVAIEDGHVVASHSSWMEPDSL